jgi:hypothetical protein
MGHDPNGAGGSPKISLDSPFILTYVCQYETHNPHPGPDRSRNSIIHMMLAMVRAQGLRSLIHLPQLIVVTFLLRSISKRFIALLDAHAAGTLSLPPAPDAASQAWQAAPARSVGTRHRSAHRAASRRRSSQSAFARLVRADVRARPYPTLCPQNRPGPRAGILATARCT